MTSIGSSVAAPSTPTRVLIVDDEHHICKAWRWMLHADEFQVEVCSNAAEALQILGATRIDVIVTDVNMPGIDGLDLLQRIKKTRPEIEVIIMTGAGSITDAVRAMQGGAFDYLTKPFSEIEECINKVRQAARLKRLREENQALRQQMDAAPNSALLDSKSPAMKAVITQLFQVARVSSNVLITGPTGSGKSVIARAIHERSPRRKGPFVAVDCGSIPSELIESELFGHVKGAFTGAIAHKAGLFEMADGGTIFLDEIGNMPMSMQNRLLRVLQEKLVRRVGGSKDQKVDVRVISATLVDLKKSIEEKTFRSDLFFRLKVVEVRLPGLNERREDIPRLAYHFLHRNSSRIGREFKGITPGCMEALKKHDWRGNVRELEHAIEAAMVFETGDELTTHHLPAEVCEAADSQAIDPNFASMASHIDLELPFREALDRADRAFRVTYLRGVMARYRSVSAAARHAQMDRANFRRLLRRYDITDYPRGSVSSTGRGSS